MRQGIKITICLLILLLVFAPAFGARGSLPQKRVLLLYSEDKAHPAHELTDQGIRAVFRSNNLFDVHLDSEYLDLSQFSGPSHTRAVTDYLGRKYAGLKIDAIITIYPAALNMLLGETIAEFPGVPIVACEIDRSTAENLERSPSRGSITGTIVGDNIRGLLDAALQMRPGTKRIALVAGTSPNDVHGERIFRKGLEPYAEKIDLIDLTKRPMEETLARVGSLPPDTVVLFSAFFADGTGKSFVPREALVLISRAANAPVFGLYESYLGYGIVGGRLVSWEQQGREAATLALRTMGGESPASIPFGGEKAYIDAYDWRELKRWDLDESALPADAIILNKTISAWEMYKVYIFGAVAFCLLETALIIFLIVQRRRKNVAEAETARVRTELRHVERSSRMGELTASLAHEINQPLGAILSSAQAALRFLESATPDLNLFRTILHNIVEDDKRAAGIITSIRSMLKREESRKESLNMNTVLDEVLNLFQSEAIVRNVTIEKDIDRSLPPVLGDKIQLQQVALNLVMNAAEAMSESPREHAKRRISLRTQATDHGIQVTVRDSGPGIDPTKLADIWKPFFTTKSTGLGMGLSISRSIVQAHGGHISAENHPDGGAMFTFEIPVIRNQ
jgi:signal transduction histidine kinase